MAITNNGTVVSLTGNKLPTGYTKPTVTTFTDAEYIRDLTLEVDKVTVDNATDTTTLANILADAGVGITAQITAILAADYLASATVTAYADLLNISTNIEANKDSDFYNADLVTYVCTVKLYVKAS